MKKFEFSENNSGGRWWLTKKHYESMFAAGWKYEASTYDIEKGYDKESFCGDAKDDVPYGWRHNTVGEFASLKDAIQSFEKATGKDFFEQGCNCCGAPFSINGDGEFMSGDSVERILVRPF